MIKRLGQLGPDFDAFVRESATPLLRMAVLLVGDRAQAEDLVQTAFLRTAARWPAARQAPIAYARRVLVNLAKDTWRTRSRRPETLTDDVASLIIAATAADENILHRDEVLRALALLPLQQRTVLVLRYLEDLPATEVAHILGCPEGTVRSLAHRALAQLRTSLTPLHPEFDHSEDAHAPR